MATSCQPPRFADPEVRRLAAELRSIGDWRPNLAWQRRLRQRLAGLPDEAEAHEVEEQRAHQHR
jgi:hypothetical protein